MRREDCAKNKIREAVERKERERERDDSHRNECIVEVRKRVKRKDKSKTIIKERS